MLNLTMSVMGLYNYDPTIFDTMVLPEQVERDTLIPGILAECSELEILYPDPNILKSMILIWSRQNIDSWKRACNAFLSDYNPIHNFDRNEEWTETGGSSFNSRGRGNGNNKTRVSAYNSTALEDREENINGNESESSGNNEGHNNHTGHLFGNIGITRTQEMIEDELRLRENNVYNIIIKSFKERFCIIVY